MEKTLKVSCKACNGTGKKIDFSQPIPANELYMMIIDGDLFAKDGYRYTDEKCPRCNGIGFMMKESQ